VSILDNLVDSSFHLSRQRLEEILGAPLGDGAHTLTLRATDSFGFTPPPVVLHFTLDATPPALVGFGLSAGSDSGTPSDNATAYSRVTLSGSSDPGSTVQVAGRFVLTAGNGTFQVSGVDLLEGVNSFTALVVDAAGNESQLTVGILREGALAVDVAVEWNRLALEAIRATAAEPVVAARALAMMSLAQYDALAAIENTPAYFVEHALPGPVALDLALAKAAHTVLTALFPSQRPLLDVNLGIVEDHAPDGEAKNNAFSLGLSAGNAILALRRHDGADGFVDYPGSHESGYWRPTGPAFDVAEMPQFADVVPFALATPEQFRPVAPPPLGSLEYGAAVEEIRNLGRATGSGRSEEQTEIAHFWADGKGSYTPPGHWNQIAQELSSAQGASLSANIRLFAMLNTALADAGVAAWDSKYTYGLWRPVDAIHNADLDGNSTTVLEAGWTPLLITPKHPEYVSGHSAFSAAAATVLAEVFGDDTLFSTGSVTLPGVFRCRRGRPQSHLRRHPLPVHKPRGPGAWPQCRRCRPGRLCPEPRRAPACDRDNCHAGGGSGEHRSGRVDPG
jgi:hypothetical protein